MKDKLDDENFLRSLLPYALSITRGKGDRWDLVIGAYEYLKKNEEKYKDHPNIKAIAILKMKSLYKDEFHLLSPKEFKLLYHRATKAERNGKLISANQKFENLMFVLEGTPIIRLQKGKQIKLTKRVWLGEMSCLRGEVTSADVLTEQTQRV